MQVAPENSRQNQPKFILRLIGDEISKGPNRKQRRTHWNKIRRKFFYDYVPQRFGRPKIEKVEGFPGLPWGHPELRTLNTPLMWVKMEKK